MRCKRNSCRAPMRESGYGKDRYYICPICGDLVYANPQTQMELEQRRELCKMRSAAVD